jgi:uncharacterized protein involved in exopolysaccharide biosynthesis
LAICWVASIGGGGSLETELQILRSRVIAGQVVDSLALQFRVREPSGTPPRWLIASSDVRSSFAPRKYEFERTAAGAYRAELDGTPYEIRPGQPGSIGVGTITLRTDSIPERFVLQVYDREDAITRFGKNLTPTKAGGDIARVVYRGDDSLTAAAAANAAIKFYLERRRTTDRGINERKVEHVTMQLDSIRAALARAESELRHSQESSGVLDAEAVGEAELSSISSVRRALTDLQVDEASVRQLVDAVDAGRLSAKDLAAYPMFIRGSAVTPLAQQLSDLEAQRVRLLERRTERDPEVLALDSTMRVIEQNMVDLARSYANGVTGQRVQLQRRLDGLQAQLLALPAAAERVGRLQRDVKRLTAIHTALEAQLVEARLASIGEGGEVKQIDFALPPRQPAFPRPVLTMGLGTVGGLLAGIVAALFLSWFGRSFRDPVEIERALGVSAQRIDPNAPLLVAGAGAARSLVIVPLDASARVGAATVAERLARSARQRSVNATIMDFSGAQIGNGNGVPPDPDRVAPLIEDLERQNGMVIVQLPGLNSEVAIAAMHESRPVLLVAPPGPVDRARLASALDTLRRLQVPCAGVVIADGPGSRALT